LTASDFLGGGEKLISLLYPSRARRRVDSLTFSSVSFLSRNVVFEHNSKSLILQIEFVLLFGGKIQIFKKLAMQSEKKIEVK